MKNLAIALLMGSAVAIQQKDKADDVYGPNGEEYKNVDANYDVDQIGIDIKEKGTGPKCEQDHWTTVHWVGYLKDGREVTNSRTEGDGRPKMFNLGAREVFYCWDLAIPKLSQGDKAHLSCPSYYVYGGAFTWAPVGGEPVPLHSDIDFDIEIVECDRVPQKVEYNEKPKTTTMQPGRCMYIHSVAAEEEATPLVITCENEDRIDAPGFNYFPAVPCYLDEFVKDNEHQQFTWEEKTGFLKDVAHEWEVCIQFGLLALCKWAAYAKETAHPAFSDHHIPWMYDGITQTLQHQEEWGAKFPFVEHTAKWASVYIDMNTHQDKDALENINAKFKLEYCYKNF